MNAGDPPARIDPDATLIVTRPEPDATRLVDGLVARGRTAFALPALAIGPPDDPAALARRMAVCEGDALVVFVSPNAIRLALAARPAPWPAATVIGVMGPGSVDALKDAGVDATIVAPPRGSTTTDDRFDSEALFDALDATIGLTRGFTGRILVVRGNGGRGWLVERLRALGLVVDEVEAYRRSRGEPGAAAVAALRALYRTHASCHFVITSSEAVAHVVALVVALLADDATPGAAREWLFDTPVIAPHRRIVEHAEAAGFRRIVGVGPGDQGLFAALE